MSRIHDNSFRFAAVVLACAALAAGILSLVWEGKPRQNVTAPLPATDTLQAFFSPAEDLEDKDIRTIEFARSNLDIAMYSFTDKRIADAIEQAAKRGVRVRIYLDALQLADQQERALRQGIPPLLSELRSYSGIEVRVKRGAESMHLKAYCVDERVLRTGSANWSQSGEMLQDNDLYLITNKAAISEFERDFDAIWDRSDNTIP